MSYADTMDAIRGRRAQIMALREEMRGLQAGVEPEAVADYELSGWDGPVRLSQLFGDKKDLIVIHNMGVSCPACTLWADGYNGVYDHLAARAAFVVATPNPPQVQKDFAAGRGWRFPMVSHQGTSFAKDMGYWRPREDGGDAWNPGISVFQKRGDGLVRVSDTGLGPYDDFCSVFHFFDLMPDGQADWKLKFRYD